MLTRLFPLIALVAAIIVAPVHAQVSDEDIDRAIKKLQTYLLANQQKGSWEHMYENPHAGKSGVSAMVIYALVASGVSVQHPQIQEAIKVLRGIEGDHVYEVGLRCHAWGQLPDEYKNDMQKDMTLLRATGSKVATSLAVGSLVSALVAAVFFGISPSSLLHSGAFGVPAWAWLALNGLIAIPLATVLLARGPRVLPSADVSMFFMLETVLTPVWIWLLFGEVPGQRVLLGGALVVIALLAHSAWRLRVSLRGSLSAA